MPVHDLRVRFDSRYSVKEFRLEPGGNKLVPEKDGDGFVVTVPRLDLHAMVIAELDPN